MKKQTLFIKSKGTHGVFNYTCYNTSIISTIIWQEGLISPKEKAPSGANKPIMD